MGEGRERDVLRLGDAAIWRFLLHRIGRSRIVVEGGVLRAVPVHIYIEYEQFSVLLDQ